MYFCFINSIINSQKLFIFSLLKLLARKIKGITANIFSSLIQAPAIPINARKMIKYRTFNLDKPERLTKHKDKKRFEQFIENKRNALLVLPRYDYSLSRSVVDIVDLNNFKVIHTYKHDIDEMNNQVKNIEEFPRLKINAPRIRFEYRHPLLFEDGSIISDSDYSIEFKIDFCSTWC